MKIKIVLILILTSVLTSVYSQNTPATWYELEFSKQLIRGLRFELKPELRLTTDFEVDKYLVNAGLEYKVVKGLRVAAYYRFYNEKKKKDDETGHRYIFDLKPEFKLQRFTIQGRYRYINYFRSVGIDNAKPFFRYRAKIKYNIKKSKVEPFVSVELYHDFKDKEIHKVRYTTGAKYAINKTHGVNVFYQYQDILSKSATLHIIGFGYRFKI